MSSDPQQQTESSCSRDPSHGSESSINCLKEGFGPYQPKGCTFPTGSRGRRFQIKWYNKFKWLETAHYLTEHSASAVEYFVKMGSMMMLLYTKVFKDGRLPLKSFVVMRNL